MGRRPLLILLLTGLVVGFTVAGDHVVVPQAAAAMKAPSVIPINPEAAKALRAQERTFRYPFPNSANQGKKFNPGGDNVGVIATASVQKVLVIFVKFTNDPPGGPASRLDLGYFDDMLFGTEYSPSEYDPYKPFMTVPTDRTLKNYFDDVSYEAVDVVTLNMPSALGWGNALHPYEYYCVADGLHDNGFGPYPNNAQGMVIDAVRAVDLLVDFSQYAVNGDIPNLFVVHAGTGAEWSTDPRLIWSHSWNIAYGTEYPDGMLVDGVRVINYATMPEVGGDLTNFLGYGVRGPYPPTVGVYAHEYGHVLGLPDQYDYGYESNGTGIYSLMGYGSWNSYPPFYSIFSGNSPAHLDAWSKYRLGFVTPEVVGNSGIVGAALPPVETSPVVYKMVVPNSGGKEYFLLENRQRLGFDQGLWHYEYDTAGTLWARAIHGLAVYHIDDVVLSRSYWWPNEAENWKEFRSEGWRRAWTGVSHYGISIIQADGWWNLERGWNEGDRGDLYPGAWGVTQFGNGTSPNSSSYYFWGGSTPKFGYSGVTVSGIAEEALQPDGSGGLVTATLSFDPWTPGRR